MLGFEVPPFGESARADLARFAATAEELGAGSLRAGALEWVERLLMR